MIQRLGSIVLVLILTSVAGSLAKESSLAGPARARSPETSAERDQRMKWWREARFGMFIHWGLYAVPAGEYKGQRSERIGEWIMDWANIPRADYEKFASQFNPVKFNAREWVRIAKDAGMKYIVITSKHHDGFAMYASEVPAYATLVEVTEQVNSDYVKRHAGAERFGSLRRVTAERHGAIRVGNPAAIASEAKSEWKSVQFPVLLRRQYSVLPTGEALR